MMIDNLLYIGYLLTTDNKSSLNYLIFWGDLPYFLMVNNKQER